MRFIRQDLSSQQAARIRKADRANQHYNDVEASLNVRLAWKVAVTDRRYRCNDEVKRCQIKLTLVDFTVMVKFDVLCPGIFVRLEFPADKPQASEQMRHQQKSEEEFEEPGRALGKLDCL